LKITIDDRPTRCKGGKGAFSGGCNINTKVGRGRGIQSFNKPIIKCFKCHKMGHFQYECLDLEK